MLTRTWECWVSNRNQTTTHRDCPTRIQYDAWFGQEIVLSNGLILPSPRQILDHDIQLHTAVVERQKALLEDILECEVSLRNAIRIHKQSHKTFNIRKIIEKQQRYVGITV